MENIQKALIQNLKKLTLFLEKRWLKNTSVDKSPISSLAPKVLAGEKDLQTIQPYLTHLKEAIDAKDINNIAITGSYGSGKSTILRTFQHLNCDQYKFLNISLASFKDNKDNQEDAGFARRLEVSILQQMFYHVEPSIIPDSRFKRIVNITSKELWISTSSLILWLICVLILFRFNYIEMLDPEGWKLSLPLNWVALASSAIFFMGIGMFSKNIYRLFKNSKIHKINIKGELELGEASDKSVFNQHLEEILYFFEKTDFNVIMIEDVDRFESTDIFTKLREINILINNSNLIKRCVKFVYAIKDEMFKDKNERVKFFEFIIPVIPFINPSNASEQLTKLINSAQLEGELSDDFTSDVVTFIDDIDMRLLINIFHEYKLYKSILSNELKQDNLFAIIVYKNLYPDDFGDLQKRKGKLHDFFFKKPTYTASIIEKQKIRIEEIDKQIELMEIEVDKPIKELRAVYVNKLASKIKDFYAFHIGGEDVSLETALDDEYFNKIKESSDIKSVVFQIFHSYSTDYRKSSPKSSKLSFLDVEKEVSNKLTYDQREKILIDKVNNQINLLKTEKEKLKQEIREVGSMSIQKLFETIDIEESLGSYKENNLMRNLLLNGHIDEHYDDYISLFHGINLTKEDFIFERKVKSGQSLPFDYSITKTDYLVKRLPEHYFGKEVILNYELLSFLLENESKYNVRIDRFFRGLSKDGEMQFEFINGYIATKPKTIKSFIKKLCIYKPSLWQEINEKSGLPEDEVKILIKQIFNYADKNSILKFNSRASLEKYLAQMNDFFAFCSSLKHTNTIQFFVTETKILFENLDVPSASTKQIFESIYTKNLYRLNRQNIYSLMQGKEERVDENKLKIAHYSTLVRLDLKILLSYIDDNIEAYIEDILLSGKENIEEEEEIIIDILNRDDVSSNLKNRLVKVQNAVITSIEPIDDVVAKKIVLENNKLQVNWGNLYNYFDAIENEEFDNVLIDFLNNEGNYTTLAKQKLRSEEREEDYVKKWSNLLLKCNQLEIQAYTSLIDCLPYTYKNLNVDSLNSDKIEALLSKKKLSLSKTNFDVLKLKGDHLHIKLIEVHQNKFSEIMDVLSLGTDDYLKILKSKAITVSNKLSLIEKLDDEIIIDNNEIAKEVCLILPEDRVITLSYEVLSAIFDSNNPISKKITLLNLNFNDLENYQVQTLIEKLGEDYVKIFRRQYKPTFTRNPEHTSLFEKLKKRALILRYEVLEKKNKYRVFANY